MRVYHEFCLSLDKIMPRKLSRVLFYAILVFLLAWLSFFAEAAQGKYSGLITGALALCLFITLFLSGRKAVKNTFVDKGDIFLWAYIFVIAIGAIFSSSAGSGINKYLDYAIPAVIIYYLFKCNFYLANRKDKIAEAVCAAGGIVSLIAILEFAFHRNIIYENFIPNPYYEYYLLEGRRMSTQFVPQVMGTYLAACMPMAYRLIFNKGKKLAQIIGWLCGILMAAGIILSAQRVSILAFMAASVTYLFFKNRKMLAVFVSLSIIFLSLLSMCSNPSLKRISVSKGGFLNSGTYEYRIDRLKTSFRMSKDFSLFGVGLGNYRLFFDKYEDKQGRYYNETKDNYYMKTPENMYLMILSESGLLGLLFFLLFIFSILRRGLMFCADPEREGREMAIVLSSGIAAILASMLTYDSLYWTTPFYIFWIYTGMLASITRKNVVCVKG